MLMTAHLMKFLTFSCSMHANHSGSSVKESTEMQISAIMSTTHRLPFGLEAGAWQFRRNLEVQAIQDESPFILSAIGG